MSAARVALVGGLISFRGLFGWLHPAIFVPTLIVPPIFQVLFFAYLGRAAELESDTFYVVGNSIQLAALPGLFAISHAINGERKSQTLASLLASPASRVALFLGRSLPVMAIGLAVSLVSFAFGTLLLDVELARPLVALAAVRDGGGGLLVHGARSRARGGRAARARDGGLLQPRLRRPARLLRRQRAARRPAGLDEHASAQGLPVTHAVEAGRDVVAGASLDSVADLLAAELAIGVAYLLLGLALLRHFETVARRRATIELV